MPLGLVGVLYSQAAAAAAEGQQLHMLHMGLRV